jgi:RNA polymerase sigma-70 factor, ECF subfamily
MLASPGLRTDELERLLYKLKRNVDRDACFGQMFRHYYSRVRHIFRGIPEESEDLTQDVFLRVFRSLETCPEDIPGFERWLSTVAHNVLRSTLQRLRRSKRQGWKVPLSTVLGEGAESFEPEDPNIPPRDVMLIEDERARMLAQAIERMPEMMYACVALRIGQNRTYEEIALVLGLAVGTVKAHLHHAREWLRKELKPH